MNHRHNWTIHGSWFSSIYLEMLHSFHRNESQANKNRLFRLYWIYFASAEIWRFWLLKRLSSLGQKITDEPASAILKFVRPFYDNIFMFTLVSSSSDTCLLYEMSDRLNCYFSRKSSWQCTCVHHSQTSFSYQVAIQHQLLQLYYSYTRQLSQHDTTKESWSRQSNLSVNIPPKIATVCEILRQIWGARSDKPLVYLLARCFCV